MAAGVLPIGAPDELRGCYMFETSWPGNPASDGPPYLRIMGEVDVRGIERTLSDQQVALVAFLYSCGPVSRNSLVQAVWDGQRISGQRVANLVAEVRSKIGRRHLPDPDGGLYQLLGVETDLDRFEHAVSAVTAEPLQLHGPLGLDRLADAYRLIRGVPMTTGNGKHWAWLDERQGLITRAESTIVEGCHRLADLACQMGEKTIAAAILEAGLLACPFDEELTTSLVDLYVKQRRPGTANRLVAAWERKIRRLGCGEPSLGPREQLLVAAQAVASGSAVTTRLPR